MDLTTGTTLKFSVRLGSTRVGCPRPSNIAESVFVQYSTNGGVTWTLMLTIPYNKPWLSLSQRYSLGFPNASKTPSTRMRWYQPIASGSDLDVWAIDDVAINIDECQSQPCQNGGTCRHRVQTSGYFCICPTFSTGSQCEIRDRLCSFNPCRNGGRCSPDFTTHTFVCLCLRGFTGPSCESQIDYCSLHQPCQNGATCNRRNGGYSCTCPRSFTGTVCQTAIDLCDIYSYYCRNGGTCTGIAGTGNVQCRCPSGVFGRQCSYDINECRTTANLCQNGGRCFNTVGSYFCACPANTTGRNCAAIIATPCYPNPCQNGGACYPLSGNSYVCWCPPRLTGRQCSHCETNLCQNGGTCTVSEKTGRQYCECVEGYIGAQCTKQTSVRAASSGPGNSGSVPLWAYIVAGVGGVLILFLLIAGIFIYKRRRVQRTFQNPAPAISLIGNPLYFANQWQSVPPDFSVDQMVANRHFPTVWGTLPAASAADDFQTYNSVIDGPSPVLVRDTFQHPDITTTDPTDDLPPTLPSGTVASPVPVGGPSNTSQ